MAVHLGNNDVKIRETLDSSNEYRAIGFIQFKKSWNEDTGRYERMTPGEQQICDDLCRQLHEAGVQIGITLQRVVEGVEKKDQPKVLTTQLFVNDIDRYNDRPAAAPAAPAAPAPGGFNNGRL